MSRMLLNLEKGFSISINVTQTDGIVLARSAFHHSLNYQSVTIFGEAILVDTEDEQLQAIKIISNQIIPNRWEEVRLPNEKEMKATKILKIAITEASVKIRKGPPIDDKSDYDLHIWAGVLPINTSFGAPIADAVLNKNILLPESVKKLIKNKG